MWPFKSKEKKEQKATARSIYSEFAQAAAASYPEQAHGLAATFKGNQQLAVLPAKEQRERSSATFRAYAENVLADDRLTEEEEAAFGDVAEALGVDQTEFATTFNDVLNRLVIARVNDGRLGEIAQPQLMTKKGEVVHLQTNANLMKEVALREWRGGTSGVSFRVAKGVSYRTGAIRGKRVVVGAELQVADSGVLAVTPTPRSSVSTSWPFQSRRTRPRGQRGQRSQRRENATRRTNSSASNQTHTTTTASEGAAMGRCTQDSSRSSAAMYSGSTPTTMGGAANNRPFRTTLAAAQEASRSTRW